MKKIVHTIIRGSIAFVFAVAPALAANNDPGVDQREINQQNRINQGIQRGQLTPREAGKLEAQQARIKQKEDRMAATNSSSPLAVKSTWVRCSRIQPHSPASRSALLGK